MGYLGKRETAQHLGSGILGLFLRRGLWRRALPIVIDKKEIGAELGGTGHAYRHQDFHENETLIGFDARIMHLNPVELWNSERRGIHLLKQDVSRVFSTDTMVWPSLFLPAIGGFSEEEERTMGWDKILERPAWTGCHQDLWEDLAHLRDCLATTKATLSKPYWIIAVTHQASTGAEDEPRNMPRFEPAVTTSFGAGWRFLGYDVSDEYLLSGLSNCGYRDEDFTTTPRARWEACLNENHLFDSFDEAEAFRRSCDERVKEHAPFTAFGLYVVDEVTG